MPPDLRRRRPLSDCFARLRRELDGTKSTRRYVPPELTSYYIDDLEPTLQIRDYTILGETTTAPYELITIPSVRPPKFDPFSPRLPHREPNAALTYWSISEDESGHSTQGEAPRLKISHTTSHLPPDYAASLQSAFTAWHKPSSQPLQVFVWSQLLSSPKIPRDYMGEETPTTFEFRCGGQSCHTELPMPLAEDGILVCFNDSIGERVIVKMLHDGMLWVYEPAGGTSEGTHLIPDTVAWKTLKPGDDYMTTVSDDMANAPTTIPRIRTLSLRALAKQFLNSTKKLKGISPEFQDIRSIFLSSKKPRRTKPGVWGAEVATMIAFGGFERSTGLYNLLVFMLQLSPQQQRGSQTKGHPRVKVVLARAYAGLPSGDSGFASALVYAGLVTHEEIHKWHGRPLGHDCERTCRRDEVSVMYPWVLGANTAEEIRCENLGINIKGWRGQVLSQEAN